MTRPTTLVVGTLVVLLALVAGLVGVPALQPHRHPRRPPPQVRRPSAVAPVPRRRPRPTRLDQPADRAHRRPTATSSRSSSAASSASARAATLVPDLAERGRSTTTGKVWTFDLRDDARWHDGIPVTAQDVVFTIRTLQDPAYTGPAAGSWSEVTGRRDRRRGRSVHPATPLGGFLQAADPADRAGPPARRRPGRGARRPSVRRGTGRVRAVRARRPGRRHRRARPGRRSTPDGGRAGSERRRRTRSRRRRRPGARTGRAVPDRIEFRFFDDPADLAAAYRAGELDAASGLPPAAAAELATEPAAGCSATRARP